MTTNLQPHPFKLDPDVFLPACAHCGSPASDPVHQPRSIPQELKLTSDIPLRSNLELTDIPYHHSTAERFKRMFEQFEQSGAREREERPREYPQPEMDVYRVKNETILLANDIRRVLDSAARLIEAGKQSDGFGDRGCLFGENCELAKHASTCPWLLFTQSFAALQPKPLTTEATEEKTNVD